MCKISVIVPIYNKSKYLERCIDSILCQTLEDIEIILINDGSTDNSLEIINNYKIKDSRIKVYDQKNIGLSETRNRGIKLATSDILSFIDCDDFIEENMFNDMYNKMIEENSEIVYSLVKTITTDGKILYDNEINTENKYFDFFKSSLALKVSSCIPTYLFKKSLFINNNIKFPKGQYFEDAATTFKLVYYANKISVLNQYYYNYFHGLEGSITSLYSDKHLNDIIKILIDTKVFLVQKNIFKKYQVEYYERCFSIISEYIKFLQNKISDEQIRIERIVTLWKKFKNINFCDLPDNLMHKIIFFTLKGNSNIIQELDFLTSKYDLVYYNRLINELHFTENLFMKYYKYVNKQQQINAEDIFHNYEFSTKLNKAIEFINKLRELNLKIVLYGAGNFSKLISSFLLNDIVCIIDQDSSLYNQKINNIQIKNPNDILDIEYDLILITVLGRESEILDFLQINLRIEDNKIFFFNFNNDFEYNKTLNEINFLRKE